MSLYKKRKRLADLILFSSIFCLAVSLILSSIIEAGILLRGIIFIAEAVLVASVADFIAITAINKKILWFKSTGLIPRKRHEIIDSIVNAISEKVLTKESISNEIEKIDTLKVLFNEKSFLAFLNNLLKENLDKNSELIASYADQPIKNALKRADFQKIYPLLQSKATRDFVDPYIVDLSKVLAEKVSSDEFRGFLINIIIEGSNQKKNESAFSRLAIKIGERTNVINYEDLSKEIIESIVSQLEKLSIVESRSERDELINKLISGAVSGLESKQVSKELYKFKMSEIDKIDINSLTLSLLSAINERAEDITKLAEEYEVFNKSMSYISNEMPYFENEIKAFLRSILEIEYETVIELVGLMLNKLSDKDLTEKINEIAGADLQWIRISGSIVGFFSGFICFLVMELPGIIAPIGILIALAIRFLPRMQKLLIGYKYS